MFLVVVVIAIGKTTFNGGCCREFWLIKWLLLAITLELNLLQIFADIEKGFQVPREVSVIAAALLNILFTEAQAGDTVLIAGKGHEDYQLIGEKRFPFSDQQQARFYLRRRESRK